MYVKIKIKQKLKIKTIEILKRVKFAFKLVL